VDDATNREKRDMDFMKNLLKEKDEAARERERLSFQMAMKREKEIRDDMRQLAASEARVAALQQQLQGQTFQLPNSRSDMFGPSGRSCFAYYPLRSKQDPWFSSPMMKETFCTPASHCTAGTSILGAGCTPSSSFVGNISCSSANVVVCDAVSQDTTTVSVLGARPTPSTTGGSQPLSSGDHSSVQPSSVSSDTTLLSCGFTSSGITLCPSSGSMSAVSTGLLPAGVVGIPPTSNFPVLVTTLVPSQGHIVSTTAVTRRVPMSDAIGVLPHVANVAPSLSDGNVASVVSSLPNVSSSSFPAYQPLVVVNTPQVVRPYNGTTNWKSFRDHFARVAKVNKWEDDSTKAQHLMLALERNAAEVLKEISDSSPTVLQDIWDALSRRFGEVDAAREALRKSEQRRQSDTESVVKFEQMLRSLYRVAWP